MYTCTYRFLVDMQRRNHERLKLPVYEAFSDVYATFSY